jgi:hypothetical protein
MRGLLRLRIRYKKYVSQWFDYLFVSPNEMADIVKGTGWEIQKLLRDDKAPYITVVTKARVKSYL